MISEKYVLISVIAYVYVYGYVDELDPSEMLSTVFDFILNLRITCCILTVLVWCCRIEFIINIFRMY